MNEDISKFIEESQKSRERQHKELVQIEIEKLNVARLQAIEVVSALKQIRREQIQLENERFISVSEATQEGLNCDLQNNFTLEEDGNVFLNADQINAPYLIDRLIKPFLEGVYENYKTEFPQEIDFEVLKAAFYRTGLELLIDQTLKNISIIQQRVQVSSVSGKYTAFKTLLLKINFGMDLKIDSSTGRLTLEIKLDEIIKNNELRTEFKRGVDEYIEENLNSNEQNQRRLLILKLKNAFKVTLLIISLLTASLVVNYNISKNENNDKFFDFYKYKIIERPVNLKDKQYSKASRLLVIADGWKPYLRKDKFQSSRREFSEEQFCYEDICTNQFINSEDAMVVREIIFGICHKDRYFNCPDKPDGYYLVVDDHLIPRVEADVWYEKIKRQFSE